MYNPKELEYIVNSCVTEAEFTKVSESIAYLVTEKEIPPTKSLSDIMLIKMNQIIRE